MLNRGSETKSLTYALHSYVQSTLQGCQRTEFS